MSRGRASPRLLSLLFVVLVACGGGGGGGDSEAEGREPFGGFGEIVFSISGGPRRCALLAETDAQHARGLMERRDLAGYDGMIFRFPTDANGGFWMRNTPLPLSIAWFDASGRFVSAADMTPCGDRDDCPNYPPGGPYRYALEVRQGGLDDLGVVPGSTLQLTDGSC